MPPNNLKNLPIGIASLDRIINNDYIYVDKTENIYDLIKTGEVYFLSRPRRFGKSLLISTLEQIFLGNKELFKNLWIYSSNYDWQEYPVVRLDFSKISHKTIEEFEVNLSWALEKIAQQYNLDISTAPTISAKLEELALLLSQKNKVVFLIDEYEKPILDHIDDEELAKKFQTILRSFYSTLKGLDPYTRFIFLTGVTKFAHTSIFSGFNNLKDLTLRAQSATLLGYTQQELESYFKDYLKDITTTKDINLANLLPDIKCWYNGYKFFEDAPTVYNPFSTLNYLDTHKFENFWFASGTPTFLLKLLKVNAYDTEIFEGAELHEYEMGSYEISDMPLLPILLQTGYLTIDYYNPDTKNYKLRFPNQEVKDSFIYFILEQITKVKESKISNFRQTLKKALCQNNLELFIETLKIFFSTISYNLHVPLERYYQTVFFVIMSMIDAQIKVEDHTNLGRIDAVIELDNIIYIIEFKINKDSKIAIQQILAKQYYQKYLDKNKKIILLGISFNTEEKNISSWSSQEYSI